MNRIERLLNPQKKAALVAVPSVSVIIAISIAAGALWAQGNGVAVPAPAQPTTTAESWERWLREDAAYIATEEEKAALRALSSDTERQKFVEQFWLRRDPTPGTADNEAKEEHYHRIDYANRLFSGSRQGWTTDRGRIYIRYGPADEVESHPAQPALPASEKWFYRHIDVGDNVIVEFVDRLGNGDYEMTSDPHGNQ